MRFLYHATKGAQLFEEDGVDHAGWHDHPEKAGLIAQVDPNGPTKWVPGPEAAAKAARDAAKDAKAGHPADKDEKAASEAPAPALPATEPALWVPIPDDWADQHWKTTVALANKIVGGETDTISTLPEAKAVIEAELARRAA
jgi:hypothetical protein